MTSAVRAASRKRRDAGGAEPLASKRRWQAILLATMLLVPAFWSLLAGIVAQASGTDARSAPDPAAALALGLAIVPFVFLLLAAMSSNVRLPGAVLAAMGLAIAVGAPVSALAGDAVTGIVAGVGAGGIVALRREEGLLKPRVWAVVISAAYVFVLVRTVGALALLPAPVLPLTGIGLADELALRRRERET